jgi:hypothetical protein
VAAEGGRVGSGPLQLGVYRLQHTAEISIDIAVPEPKDAKTFVGKAYVTNFISSLMLIEVVLAPVEFDRQSMLHADKVNDKSVARRLPSKVISAHSP